MEPLYLLKWVIVFSAGSLALIGILRLSMTAMGFRVIQSWENHFDIKIPKFEIGVKTKNLGVAIIVLELLFLFAFKALDYQDSDAARADKAQAEMTQTPPLPLSGYAVAEETVNLDLRKRQQLSLLDWAAGNLSKVEWKRNKVIKSTGSTVKELNFRHATSGREIIDLEIPQDADFLTEIKEALYNPFVKLLSGEFFTDLIKKEGQMKTYYMTVPVTAQEGQEIDYTLEYHNAFQGKDFEWAGNIFSADTDMFTMFIVFPENKPYTSFKVYKKGVGGDKKVEILDPNVSQVDTHALKWKIQNAKKGEKYYIKWTW